MAEPAPRRKRARAYQVHHKSAPPRGAAATESQASASAAWHARHHLKFAGDAGNSDVTLRSWRSRRGIALPFFSDQSTLGISSVKTPAPARYVVRLLKVTQPLFEFDFFRP